MCLPLPAGYKTALAYYSFDNLTQKEPWTKTGQFMKSHPLKWDGFSEPGRKSPVVSCKGSDGACMETSTLPCFRYVQLSCDRNKDRRSNWCFFIITRVRRDTQFLLRRPFLLCIKPEMILWYVWCHSEFFIDGLASVRPKDPHVL